MKMTNQQGNAVNNTLHVLYTDEHNLAAALTPSEVTAIDGEAYVVTKVCEDGFQMFVGVEHNPETGMREPFMTKATRATRWSLETAERLAGEFRADKATFQAVHWVEAYSVQLDQVEEAIESLEALL